VSVGLSGNLRDFGIADVFQLIGQQRKTGQLRIRQKESGALLFFNEGAVVSAFPELANGSDPLADMLFRSGWLRGEQTQALCTAARNSAQPLREIVRDRGWLSEQELGAVEDRLTRDTIFDVLRWEGGSFDFQPRESVPERPGVTRLGAEQILMDGLRMLDEWRTFAGRVPSEDVVFRRCDEVEVSDEALGGEAGQRLLAHIDGRLSARQVIDFSQLGNFEGTRLLARCVDAGLLERVAAPAMTRAWMAWAEPSGRSRGVRVVAEVAFPLLVLSLVVFALGRTAELPVTGMEWPIPRVSLERAAELEHMRGLRKRAEVFELLEARWPVSLEDLAARGLVDASALASPRGRPYHSEDGDEVLVLLAPDP